MKLNRKWLLAIALVLSLTMAISGTLAYLTDRDTVENVFTMGNVDIEVEEEFDQNSPLYPGVEVDKKAGITNTHATEDAYVWMVVSVPTDLAQYIELGWADDYSAAKVDSPHDGYTGYLVKYPEALTAGSSTGNILESVKLAANVDYQNGQYVAVSGGQTEVIGDLSNVTIMVDGFAIQTEGFTGGVEEAYTAYTTQWGGLTGGESGEGNEPSGEPVESAEALLESLKTGAGDIAYIGDEAVVISSNLEVEGESNIDMGGAVLKFENGAKIFANGAELTITDAKIESDGNGTIFEVANGSVVTLGKDTVIENTTPADGSSLFNMYDYNSENSKVVLDGATITGNDNNGEGTMFSVGYGTQLVIEEGTVINGNTFSGNTSNRNPYALINIASGGEVVMNGGRIIDNEFSNYALIYIAGGKFVMNGGEISANEYTGSNSASLIQVATSASTFDMTNGKITGNTITGGYVLNAGGGTANITGGEITGNTAAATGYVTFGAINVGTGATVDGY